MDTKKRNIRLLFGDKVFYIGTINVHSISMHQKLFDLFCSVTKENKITSINFLNWINSFKVLSLNEFNDKKDEREFDNI